MKQFDCNEKYEADLQTVTRQILEKAGVSSPIAEREIIVMANEGNTVAAKLYGDLVFYKKIYRKAPYLSAFSLYLRSAGITIEEQAEDSKGSAGAACWHSEENAYPLSYWILGYYLVNYKRESILQKSEKIPAIDVLSFPERMALALRLALACIRRINVSGALNLIGRILQEASSNDRVFAAVKPVIEEELLQKDFAECSLKITACETKEDCVKAAERFFMEAAKEGYIYACNNLAAREADQIIRMFHDYGLLSSDFSINAAEDPKKNDTGVLPGLSEESAPKEGFSPDSLKGEIERHVNEYVRYLKLSADKYEPYAANRLGLFYMTGEINNGRGKINYRSQTDSALAKTYFLKATVYPDANSAWAYFNLIKYFHRDYDKDIALLNEHMDYIRQLNPEIYDLAIEL